MSQAKYSTTTGASTYKPPETLQGVADELTRGFSGEVDQDQPGQSLLRRLEDLVPPGRSGKGGGRPQGSGARAPWSATAELLDEIRNGALSLSAEVRVLLDMGPLTVAYRVRQLDPAAAGGPICAAAPDCGHPTCETVGGWRWQVAQIPAARDPRLGTAAALRDLARLEPLLRDRHPEHELVKGSRRGELGRLEADVRRWHWTARERTGHATAWPRVAEMPAPNPHRVIGPTCAVRIQDDGGWGDCAHRSCRAVRAGAERLERYVAARCPYCDSPSLRQNPETGSVLCMRPTCRTDDGQRYSWTVDELQRLGLVMVTPS